MAFEVDESNGDHFLSGWDNKLWRTQHYILLKFGVPVIFKDHRTNYLYNTEGHTAWFIPRGVPNFQKIKDFLYQEFKDDIRVTSEIEVGPDKVKDTWLGWSLVIREYAGQDAVIMEAPESKEMAKAYIGYLKDYLKRPPLWRRIIPWHPPSFFRGALYGTFAGLLITFIFALIP